jgi:hypothetical protein
MTILAPAETGTCMPTFRIIILGHFCGPNGPKLVGIPEFAGARAAGFYTTRVIEASDPDEATKLAADSIYEELSRTLGREQSACSLEVESCEDISDLNQTSLSRGFTFFAED